MQMYLEESSLFEARMYFSSAKSTWIKMMIHHPGTRKQKLKLCTNYKKNVRRERLKGKRLLREGWASWALRVRIPGRLYFKRMVSGDRDRVEEKWRTNRKWIWAVTCRIL
jgi:hypothetical protein